MPGRGRINTGPCLHCGRVRWYYSRHLCVTCGKGKSIRDLYPLIKGPSGRPSKDTSTEAELDAIIAEQMANLPPWWEAESARHRAAAAPREPKVYTLGDR